MHNQFLVLTIICADVRTRASQQLHAFITRASYRLRFYAPTPGQAFLCIVSNCMPQARHFCILCQTACMQRLHSCVYTCTNAHKLGLPKFKSIAHTDVHTNVHSHTLMQYCRINALTCVHTHTNTHTRTHTHAHTCTQTHTHTHTRTHTHTHTHMLAHTRMLAHNSLLQCSLYQLTQVGSSNSVKVVQLDQQAIVSPFPGQYEQR